MTTLEVKLDLPDSLAKEAQQAGLLTPQALETMLSEAVRSRRRARLMEARRNIAAADVAPLTMDEIQAEIEADRAERRGKIVGALERAARPATKGKVVPVRSAKSASTARRLAHASR